VHPTMAGINSETSMKALRIAYAPW
jgi:hypothetical protein